MRGTFPQGLHAFFRFPGKRKVVKVLGETVLIKTCVGIPEVLNQFTSGDVGKTKIRVLERADASVADSLKKQLLQLIVNIAECLEF